MNTFTIQRLPRFFAVALALAVSIGVVFASLLLIPMAAHADTAPPDPTNPASPPTVSADALPTTQIDGVAWAQVVVGDTVYVAGKFSTARPAGAAPGVNTVVRNNILAYNIKTGALITTFHPSLNAQALGITATPDGSRIYVVGDFTSVDGAGFYRAAAFSTATGAIIPSFRPILESQGRAVVATNTAVYLGGTFSSVNSQARGYVAKVNASDGSVASWNPNADSTVAALALTPDGSKVIMGGRFSHVGGGSNYGLAAADTTTGSVLPWAANQSVRDAGTKASITALYATNDRIYGSGYVFGSLSDGNLEGIFSADPNTGNISWVEDCHGDTYSVYAVGDVVYGAGHPHYCGNIGGYPQTTPWTYHHTVAFSKAATGTITPDPYGYYNWAGTPSPSLLNWFPQYVTGSYTGQGQAAWSLSGNSSYVVVGGEFPYVNGVAQAGLTRFAVASLAPNKVGPNVNTALVPTVASFKAGEARVSWTSTYDQDNTNLTYSLVRDKSTNVGPIYTTTQEGTFWQRVNMGFIDKGLTPGSTHTYRIFVTDPFGNSVSRLSASVTVASTNAGGAYASAVAASNPSSYWPLNESSGTTGFDHTGFNDLVVGSGVSRGTIGPVPGNNASTFDGTTSGIASTQTAIVGPDTFTTEAWVNTTSTAGGKIIGFGASPSGDSGSYDRMIYMDNAGKIYFGVYPGSSQTLSSSASLNNGQWHHVVASLGSNGMRLYVDGKVVGSRTDVTTGQAYSGYWRIGGDNLNGWPSQPSSSYLNGSIGQVAIYPSVLSASQVVNHYVASGRTVVNDPPTAAFTSTVKKGVLAADASGSTDPDGTVDSYAWDFGDGSSGTGVTASHTYASAGTYTVALTVTDNAGATATATRDVTVLPVLPAPADAYGAAVYQSNPDLYWRLGEVSGTTANDASSNANTGTYHSGVTLGKPGGVAGTTDTAARFDGVSGLLSSNTSMQAPTTYSEELWFNTTTASGGKLIGFGNQATGTSNNYDRHVYMETNGQLTFGTYTGQTNTVTSSASYNNGQWHHMVATQSSAGMMLYVDGQLVGTNPQTGAQDYPGYWRVGSDTTWGPQPYFDGTIDEVAVYFTQALSPATVLSHYTLGSGGAAANQRPVAAFTSTAVGLTASFDGSGSADPDGSIASYSWDFGDLTAAGIGVKPSHSYAAAGTYHAVLTVTDNQGATGTVTHDVIVTAVNQKPVAAFTSTAVGLAASFDGSGSADPDGSIASYSWDFGDLTAAGTGAKPTHSYAAAGTYQVKLTVTDNQGATSTITDPVTVAIANVSPTAAFTSTVSNLAASFEGSGSVDPDGTIASYAWNFGDGQTGSGATVAHSYAAAGTYTVSLTVTDNKGATATVTHPVTAVAPPANVIAQANFDTAILNSWGLADVGGAWTNAGAATAYLVADGVGQQIVPKGSTKTSSIPGASAVSTDLRASFTTDKAPTGGGIYVSAVGRDVVSTNYQARVWLQASGAAQLQLLQGATALRLVNIPGITYTAGTVIQVRLQVFGTSPTTVRAKVWAGAQTEPAAWQASVTDTTAALQTAGTIGLRTYLSSTATTTPVTTLFDNLLVIPQQ